MKHNIKSAFPIFSHHPDLVYLDSGATTLKPQSVIDKITEYYGQYSANISRGMYDIAETATTAYELTRKKTAGFIHAESPSEIVFTRNTTESLNLVCSGLRGKISKNDEIVVTAMDHHSNFVPWQELAKEKKAVFKVWGINRQTGRLLQNIEEMIPKKTKILAIPYVSNVLGIINPVKEIIKKAKRINPQIIVVVDAAQAAPHIPIDVQDLGCDFLAFSAHKMCGPTGLGILWGRYELLDQMKPLMFGGGMIEEVTQACTTFQKPPHKFEAGTPAIAEVIGFSASIDYIRAIGFETIRKHEQQLLSYALSRLKNEFKKDIHFLGNHEGTDQVGSFAFTFNSFHPHDIASILNEHHIAVRAGFHCAMPLHTALDEKFSVRVSMYLYNTKKDIDKLIKGLHAVNKTLSD